ncbi:response regulator [Streptomyces sp. BH106]|jgi:DNA-binding NarL/FixJ family response regulator|uniref:response regulator n=1 Tax=Streptomyces sp. BH106 TaxID=3410409 RepID=UPI003CF3D489
MTGEQEMISVFVVDDHEVVRRGIASFLEFADGIAFVGEASDGREALDRLAVLSTQDQLPDVMLLDLRMPRLDGAETAAIVAERYPDVRTVILTSFSEIERVQTALANGASGYVLKDAAASEVEAAIRATQRDEVFIDAAVAGRLTKRLSGPGHGVGSLSARERDVLVLVGRGLSNRAIAERLAISERTARTHVSKLLTKLNLNTRTQAALVAVREGLVDADPE